MVFSWLNATKAKQFGISLADFYLERSKVDAQAKSSKFVEKKQRELLGKVLQQVVQFKASEKLNVYKKAQLGNVFKWRLLEAGHDRLHADELTRWLMHNLK
ncbi:MULTISPECIES: hypothetical protein [unclassified Undibacterium]|uniref:hypothetical protein n=1 Tax=unclassified Undibacterium TaxID=2630295 RepID=UPI002AC9D5F7|nr:MULTISPECIES: hypothetical protein [unclassified Undibacterium]MEB0139361.1 hypothetical protein [Undibacterium sp. CCC2.1]MEB0173374.1 hypothetical protein [Undibacterium sp. CCC1.1]MEB0177239.1 hypothetical protein [Undibacterium sp. CCC3.4]MEB0216504.1 hypothetical protein [Undibacterium sp. 5I2]WPX44066.1 hypothetical protein RHM61_02220 [Undibacterium sp. CCC3.4]